MWLDKRNRRQFLQGTGGVLLALPFLPSLWPKGAGAQSGGVRRFIAIKSYSTQNIIDWYPQAGAGLSARPYSLDDGKQDGTVELLEALSDSSGRHRNGNEYFGHFAPMSAFTEQGLSRIVDTRFNRYLQRALLIRGLDFMPDTNHNEGGMLGNYAAADVDNGLAQWPTIDQVLAYSSQMYGQTPAGTRSLHLSPGRANTFSFTHGGIAGGSVSQVSAHVDPLTAFNEAFGNFTAPDAQASGPDPNVKLIDRVLEDYNRVRNSSRLGSADRQTLEQHVTFLSELQNKLDSTAGAASCQAPDAPPSMELRGVDVAQMEQVFNLMVDVMVAAIRCDMTRVATLNVWKGIGRSIGPNGSDLGFVHSGLKDAQDWHETAHRWGTEEDDRKILAINQWIANEVVLRVLDGLDVDEGDGTTFLDNSIVLWGNELGMNHLNWSVPALLFGSAGGRLATGRYIDFIDWNQPVKFHQHNGPVIEGVPYNRLLVSLLQAYGLEPADYEQGGQPGYGVYSTDGKETDLHAIDYDASQYGNGLPTLLV